MEIYLFCFCVFLCSFVALFPPKNNCVLVTVLDQNSDNTCNTWMQQFNINDNSVNAWLFVNCILFFLEIATNFNCILITFKKTHLYDDNSIWWKYTAASVTRIDFCTELQLRIV